MVVFDNCGRSIAANEKKNNLLVVFLNSDTQ